MKRLHSLLALFILCAAPAAARINMMEPWAPAPDFRIPKETWNHDTFLRAGFGRNDVDFFELGYLLAVPVSPDLEVGGGLSYLSVDGPGGSESGFGDIPLGAKYKVPKENLPAGLEIIGEGGITLPTGDPDKFLGAGGFGLFAGGSIQGALAENVTPYAHLGFRFFMKGQDTDLGEVIEYAFGLKTLLNSEWIGTADVRGFSHGKDEYRGVEFSSYDEIYLAPGAIFRPKGVPAEFLGTLLLGLTDDSFDFGLQLGAKF